MRVAVAAMNALCSVACGGAGPHRPRDAICGVAAVPDHPELAFGIGHEHFARPVHMGHELRLVARFEGCCLARIVGTVRATFKVDPPLPPALDDYV